MSCLPYPVARWKSIGCGHVSLTVNFESDILMQRKRLWVQPETDSVLSSVKWILKNVARLKVTGYEWSFPTVR